MTAEQLARALDLAKVFLAGGDSPPLYGPNTVTLARALLAIAAEREQERAVVEAAQRWRSLVIVTAFGVITRDGDEAARSLVRTVDALRASRGKETT